MRQTAQPGARGAPSAPGLARAARLRRIMERDGEACVWCRRPLVPGHPDASLEHVIPRLKGGPAWLENELCACRSCNRRRGHTAPVAWLEACAARGLDPDLDAVGASLERLREAIARRAGQRRARPYLDGQLRRLAARPAAPRDGRALPPTAVDRRWR